MKLLFTSLFSVFFLSAYSQLENLEYELFENQKQIIFKLDSALIRTQCRAQYREKSSLNDKIKYVVNVDSVLAELKKIAFYSSKEDAIKLEKLYFAHISNFKKYWGKIYLNNCLLDENQIEAKRQFKVLSGFESTLKSLALRGINPDSLWNCLNEEYTIFKNPLINKDGFSKYEKIHTYSKYFKELNKKAWYASTAGFTYLDPYIPQIKEHLIKELEKCSCPIDANSCKNLEFIRHFLIHYIVKIDDKRIPEIFLKNSDCLSNDPSYFWFPVKYLESKHHPELLKFTLSKLFEAEPAGHIEYKLGGINSNGKNLPIFQEELIKAVKNGSKTAINYSFRFANKKTLKALKTAKKKYRKNKELDAAIELSIDRIRKSR